MRIAAHLAIVASYLSVAGCAARPAYDVVVYGGTSAGVIAAVKASRLGRSVLLIEPTRHLGGLSSSGLGATDFGNKDAIGGMSRDFYRRAGAHYGEAEAWRFEPHVAERVFDELVNESSVAVWRGERLRRERLSLARGRIARIATESGRTVSGRVFIDCTYEGDLMACAGVTYVVGREPNSRYGESLNGVQAANATKHQFLKDVSPYVRAGDASSGLLPGIEAGPPEPDGAGDQRVQAYNFRMCLTDDPANRRDWERPVDYDERLYELLLRNFEAGDAKVPLHSVPMPNRKTDTNNNGAVSTDFLGANYEYPEAGYERRAEIAAAHRSYQLGLMWTLAHHPRVPESVRAQCRSWGLARDEFGDNDNWPRQIYVREARRMVSDYVVTQHDCQGRAIANDPVGLGAYTMDSHNVRRYVDARGFVRNEGDVQVGGFPPYGISYRAIVPRRGECANLLVPVCASASHIAYGSLRMEPVFMVLGESAAVAAALAIERGCDVQDVPHEVLAGRLRDAGQRLERPR